jgi:putative Mg2+ transporter-C (MgtC) family protein
LLQRIVDTLLLEFADATDPEQITRIVVRLAMAALLGGLVGRQRERMRKAAGARTHMLVAMGAALFVLVPEQGGMALGDLSRVVQGIIAGMGFLGAGAILKNQSELSIVGLTTAAGVWMTAAIGVACGLGRESTALISTVLVLFVFAVVPKVTAPSES